MSNTKPRMGDTKVNPIIQSELAGKTRSEWVTKECKITVCDKSYKGKFYDVLGLYLGNSGAQFSILYYLLMFYCLVILILVSILCFPNCMPSQVGKEQCNKVLFLIHHFESR